MADNFFFHATAPWLSADSAPDIRESWDAEPQALRDMCLSCTRAECVNCIAGGVSARRGRPTAIKDMRALAEALELKQATADICRAFAISPRTLCYYKKKINQLTEEMKK